jgi:hypothetical protein
MRKYYAIISRVRGIADRTQALVSGKKKYTQILIILHSLRSSNMPVSVLILMKADT